MSKNPKGKKLTPRQEDAIERDELLRTRARIIELGVARWINDEGSSYGMEECSKLLAQAVQHRRDARLEMKKAFPDGMPIGSRRSMVRRSRR